MGEAKLPI
jgi:hypothetical protein